MADTQIRFTVEGVQSVQSAIDSILQKSETLTDNIIAQGRIATEDLQAQIELLKQRNGLAIQKLGGGFIKNLESTNDLIRQQIRLLKSRNDAARGGFRNEVQNNPLESSGRASSDEGSGGVLGPGNEGLALAESVTGIADSLEYLLTEGIRISPDTIEDFIESLKALQGSSEGSSSGRGSGSARRESSSGDGRNDNGGDNFNARFFGNLALQTAIRGVSMNDPMQGALGTGSSIGSALMSTGNPYAIAGGAILSVLTAGFQKAYEVAQQTDPYAKAASRIFDTDWMSEMGMRNNLASDLGLSREESIQQQIAIQRATGGRWGRSAVMSNARDAMEWQTRVGLDENSIAQLATVLRTDDSGRGINSLIGSIFLGMQNAGVSQNRVTALLPELINNIQSLALNSQNTAGYSNIDTIIGLQNLLSNKSEFGDFFSRNPALMGSVMSSIMNGLTSPSTPQMEALQYQTLAQINPGASFWELQVARDVPSAEYAAGVFENLRRVSGYTSGNESDPNREIYARNLMQAFGVRASVADQLSKGEISTEDFMKEVEKSSDPHYYERSIEGLMSNVGDKVSSIEKLVTEWNELFKGDNENISKIVTTLSKTIGKSVEKKQERMERKAAIDVYRQSPEYAEQRRRMADAAMAAL